MPKQPEPDMFADQNFSVPVGTPDSPAPSSLASAAAAPVVPSDETAAGGGARALVPAVVVDTPPPSYESKTGTALADLREQAMNVPVPVMQQGLAEYKERRDAFRAWLLPQLIEGVHFGFPPGCQPVFEDQPNANPPGRYYKSGKNWNHESVWRPKPSLYEAGANFILDLMGWRDECKADMDTWEQLGKPSGSMIRKCELYSRSTDKYVASGTGGRVNGDKYMDLNASVKMADKSARVAAVKNALGLSDLFTQDIEDAPRRDEYPPPPQNADAPNPRTRGERQQAPQYVPKVRVAALFEQWVEAFNDDKREWSKFVAWARGKAEAKQLVAAPGVDIAKPDKWDQQLYDECVSYMPPKGDLQ